LQRALATEGVLTVWAAGNDGPDNDATNPPGQDPTPGIIMVASYDDLGAGTRNGVVSDDNPNLARQDRPNLLQSVAITSGLPKTHMATLVPQAGEALAIEAVERGRTPVLVLDEAHLLDHAQLEGIRMLTNYDMDSRSPFACLLVGQPTLRRKIKLGILAALDQRIALRYALAPMTGTETADYVKYHLALAGRSDTLFSDDATALIHQTSRGLPRAVNNLAVQALVAAFSADKTIVDESAARAAVTEVTTE
jgi:type II secretory pathway predicted ATPase ExeA